MKLSAQKAVARTASRPSRSVVQPIASAQKPATRSQLADALLVSSATVLLSAAPAVAAESDSVDTTINTVIGAVRATGELVKSGITGVQAGVQVLKEGYEVAAPVIKQGYDVVLPVVTQAAKTAGDLAAPAIQSAAPALSNTVRDIVGGSGVDLSSASSAVSSGLKTASAAATTATPVVNGLVNLLTTTDPTTLGEVALGAVAIFYLAPGLAGVFKGYKGELSAASALDAVVTEPNVVLVDIRSYKEKESSGVPDVPGSASSKVIEVEFAALEDKRLRSQLKDPNFIEAQTTALQISSLKRIGKGTKVLLLDRYGNNATAVAKELAKKGYGQVFLVSGGFDGRAGWIQSKLQIKPFTSLAFAAAGTGGRTGTRSTRALPAPKA